MDRAYSVLQIKAFDDEERVIRGLATSPEADRVGDQVMPLGIKYTNPMPLLWQHKHDKPIGTVRFDTPTAQGVTFEARLPKIEEPGALKDRVDEAWQSVKAGLVTAVSIGFRALDGEVERLKSGGLKFLKTEVIELSLVTIGAHPSALITAIKSIDADQITHQRENLIDVAPPPAPVGAKTSATSRGAVKLIPRRK